MLSSLGLPGPLCGLTFGNFGRLVGNNDDNNKSDTLVDNEGVGMAGIVNSREEAAVLVEAKAFGGNEAVDGEDVLGPISLFIGGTEVAGATCGRIGVAPCGIGT